MKIMQKSIAVLMIICMMFTMLPMEFYYLYPTVEAGVIGDTLKIETESKKAPKGGAINTEKPFVRVYLSREKENYLDGTEGSRDEVYKHYTYKYPKSENLESLFFVDKEYYDGWGFQTFITSNSLYVADYTQSPTTGLIYTAGPKVTNSMIRTNPTSTIPKNIFKENVINAKKSNVIESSMDLSGKVWEQYRPNYEQALAHVNYVFQATPGMNQRFINAVDKNFNIKDPATLTDDEKFNIATGYGGLLVSLYVVAANRGLADTAGKYSQAIEEYFASDNLDEKPVSLVVDGAFCWIKMNDAGTHSTGYRIAPCIELMEYILATEANYSITAPGADTFIKTRLNGAGTSTINMITEMAKASLETHPWETTKGYMNGTGGPETMLFQRLSDTTYPDVWQDSHLNTSLGFAYRVYQFGDVSSPKATIWTTPNGAGWDSTTRGGLIDFFQFNENAGTKGFLIASQIISNPVPEVSYFVKNVAQSTQNTCDPVAQPQSAPEITITLGKDSGLMNALIGREDAGAEVKVTTKITRDYALDSFSNIQEQDIPMPALEAEFNKIYSVEEFVNSVAGTPLVAKDTSVLGMTIERKTNKVQEMLFTYHVDVTITIDKAVYEYKAEDIVVRNGTEALNTIQFHINAYMEDVVLPEDIVITKPSSTTTTDIINPSENEDLANNTQLVHRYEYASTVDDDEIVVGFAEAKSNEPLDEEWEVMAGIPSSEEIYFSVGGQEFKVAAILQYWMNEHSRDRTYTMHFDGVKCEYNNEGKGTGDRMAEYFPKAQPTAGGSYTDVSIHCKNEDSSGNGDWKIVAYWSGNSKHDPQNHPCSVCGATIHDNHGTLDTSKYDEAVAAADLLQSQLEAEIIQWTAASDKVLREITWEVSYTAPHDTADGTTTGSDGSANCEGNHGQCGGHPWGPDSEGNSGVNYDSGAAHNTGSPCSSSHAWSITLTATIPDHAICGPCCGHHLPPLWDMWRQGLVYDYVKIGQIRLYALDQGSAEGFTELTGTDKIFANVISGNPTYFMNIAQMTETSQRPKITNGGLATQDKLELGGITYNNYYDYTHYSGQNRRPAQSSRAGRLRYMLEPSLYKTAKKEWTAAEDGDGKGTKITLEYNKVAAPEQHDDVIYKIGVRSTNCDGMSNHYNFGLSGTSVEPVSDLGHKNEWADGCLYTHLLSTTSYSGYHEYGSIGYTYQPKQLAENDVLAMNGTYHEDYNHHVQRDGLTDKEAYSDKADQKDILTEEWMAFNEARRTKIIVDVISDFLIMQTSGGDQSLFYFEKVSPPTEAQEHFQKVKITEKECLDDNPLSIFKAGICPSNVIKDGVYNFEIVGGYNGRYDVPAKKYKPYSLILNDFLKFENEGWSEYNASYDNSSFQTKVGGNYIYTGNSKITTIFDKSFYGTGDPAKTVGRPERKAKNQSTSFKIYQDGIQILPTAPNQLYQPENGLIWYSQLVGYWCTDANVIDATNGSGRRAGPLSDVAIGNPQKSKHSDAYRANWGTNTGVQFNTKYFLRPDGDSGTTTINGIVVYTPVSVEDAIVLPQGNFNIEGKSISRDQRVNTFDYPDMNDLVNKLKVCPLDPASCEYRVLDCKYLHDTVLAEFNFEPTYNTTEEDTSGDYEHNRKPVTKKNTYTEGGKTYTTNLVNGITYELPSGFTIGTSGFVDGQFLSATGTNSWKIPFSDLGLSSIKTNRVKVSMNLKVNSASNVMVVSFRNLGFIVDSTSNGRFIKTSIDAPSRVGTTKKLTPTIQNVKLDIVFGFNNIIDCTAYVNGVEAGVSYVSDYREQWNTTTNADGQVISKKVLTDVVLDAKALKNEPPTPLSSNDLGGSINIGNWTNGKSNYSANYYIDNLKIILMGGTTEHTSSCYVTETIHNTKMLHVCDENCYLKEDLYTCTGDLNANYQHGDAYPINWYVCNGVLNSGVVYDCGITNLMHKCTNCGAQAGFYRHCSSGCRQCTCNNCGAQQGHRYGNSNCTGHVHSTSGCTWHYTTHTHSGTEGATSNGCYTKGIHKHYGTAGTDTPNGCYTTPTKHTHYTATSNYTKSFSYTGGVQSIVLAPGQYKLEAWGASGGGNSPDSTTLGSRGGYGGYTSGVVSINKQTTLYVYVGGAGTTVNNWTEGGWNGGGGASYTGKPLGTGGGATDFRLVGGAWNNTSSLQSRILVAGGGGGSDDIGDQSGTFGGANDESGGSGGGLTGQAAYTAGTRATYGGGAQTSGGSAASGGVSGSFGIGGGTTNSGDYGGGGGGYYGGASGGGSFQGGAGGSSFVTGYTGCDTTYRNQHQGLNFTKVVLNQNANIGNGKAKISLYDTCTFMPKGSHVCTGIPNQISDYNVHQHTTDCFEDYYTLPARSFMYTGDVQTYTVPYSDYYKIEVYGPSSGNKCGYASAVVFLNRTKQLYIYVGGTGGYNSKTTDVRMVAYPTNANSAIGEEALLTEAQQNSLDSRILIATGSMTGTKVVSLANYPLTDVYTSLKGNDTNGRVIITPLNRTPHLKGETTILEQILAGDIIEEDAHKYLGEELANTIINTAQVFKTYDKFSWLNTQGVTPATTATEGVSFSNNRIICQVNTSGGDEFYLPIDVGAKALRQVHVTLNNYTSSTSFGIHMGTVNGTKLYTSVPMSANSAEQTIKITIPKTWRAADIKNLWFDPSPGTGLTGRVEISKIQLIGHADVLKDNNASYALSNLVTTKTFTSSDKKGFANLSNTSLTFSNNNMVVTSSGSNPQTVWNAIKTIDTSAVKAIKLVFTNKSASATTGELYYKDATNTWNETDVFKWNVGSSSVGAQTVWIDTVNHSAYNETTKVFTKAGSGWTGTVTGIRFDWTQLTSGGLEVSEITFIGKGTMSVDYTYDYTGTAQSIKLPKGTWQVDLWGAQGGDGRLGNTTTMVESGGKGGHTEGQITADGSTTYYIYIGGKGGSAGTASQSFGAGGWNGGGPGGTELRPEGQPENGAGGGGMTHITTSSTDKLTTSPQIGTTSAVKYNSGYSWSYAYTGGSQTVTLLPGTYKLEVWGAGGGYYQKSAAPGGYASGTITLTSATSITINVGGAGSNGSGGAGGWNGGANGASHSGGGGGKTDIAVNGTIVIAGGGGGAGGHNKANTTAANGGYTLSAYGSGGGSAGCNARSTGGASYIGGVTNGTATAGGGSAAQNHGKAVITATTAIYDTAYSMGVTETATFDTSKVIMVAGGGGGGSGSTGSSDVAGAVTWGGNGGGTSGVSTNTNTTAGTQTSGYKQGLGGPGYSYFPGSSDLNYGSSGGGGGGWYGGYTSSNLTTTGTRGGAGGSGYIKSGTVTGGSTTAGQRSGNGYATIKSVSVTGTVLFNSGTGSGKFGIATATYSPVRFQAAYKNPFENETTARKTIYDNIDLIPDFVDGDYNPIWVCKFAEINGHACEKVEKDGSITTLCVTQTRLDCREPHHKGVMTDKDGNVLKDDNGKPICKEHYGGSNRICWSACENDDNHKNTKDEVQVTNGNKVETLKLADYLQLDEGFTIYFPNIGDFKGNNALGLAAPQLDRGYGYSNRMETTRWTREKRVRFPFDVIFEEVDGTQQIYKAYSWIELDVPTEYFNFYLLVENQEMSNASVEFECEAINCATSEGLNVAPGVTYSNTVSDTYATALQNFLDTYVATMYNEVKKGYQMPLAVADGKNTISSTAYDKTGYLNFYVTKETVNEAKLRTAMSKINSTIEKEFEGDTSGVINPHNNKFTGINEDVKLITYNDNKVRVNNKVRADSLQSLHGGYKHFYLDVIGRIGNFAIVDTEDFRFSNFFKMPIMSDSDASAMDNPDNWVVEGLVKVVDDGVQNFYVGDTYDLRGNKAGVNNRWLDTYGTMSWMAGQLINGNRDITKPNLVSQILTGEINNIDVFKEEELRYGYDAYTSIITFGSYDTGSVQVVPKYYALKVTDRDLDNVPAEFNVKKGTYIPLDVYIDADGVYSPVNIFGNAGNGNSNIGGIEMNDYSFNLDWTDEELRRNYSLEEKARTLKLKEEFKRVVYDMSSVDVDDTDVDYSKLPILKIIEYPAPQGKANYLGTSQYILMTASHRTFVGSSNSYDNNTGGKSVWNSRAGTMTVEVDKNIVDAYDTSNPNAINEIQFERAVQRWHGKLGLPSSAIFVPHNTKSDELTKVNEETIEYVMGENQDDWVIVCTAETIAIGAVWSIYYSQPWFDTLTINGNSFKTSAHYPGHRITDGNGNSVECPDCIPPIISVFGKTSVDDVEIVQTH